MVNNTDSLGSIFAFPRAALHDYGYWQTARPGTNFLKSCLLFLLIGFGARPENSYRVRLDENGDFY